MNTTPFPTLRAAGLYHWAEQAREHGLTDLALALQADAAHDIEAAMSMAGQHALEIFGTRAEVEEYVYAQACRYVDASPKTVDVVAAS